MSTFLLAVLATSLAMSAVMVLLMLLNKALANRVTAAFPYYLWLVVLLGLLIPFRSSMPVPLEPVQLLSAREISTTQQGPPESFARPVSSRNPHASVHLAWRWFSPGICGRMENSPTPCADGTFW